MDGIKEKTTSLFKTNTPKDYGEQIVRTGK